MRAVRYEYRDRVPPAWMAGTFVVAGVFLSAVLAVMEGGLGSRVVTVSFGVAAGFVALAAVAVTRYHLTVTEDAISYLPTKVTIPTDRVFRVFLASGRKQVSKLRNDLTFTRRVHAPPWTRSAAWILVRRDDGRLDNYLLAIGAPDAFIAALDRGWDDVAEAYREDLPPAGGGA